ncbi:MAG: Hsp33 family molecular chaperone HslO [Firmicutes bacterium]|nr:Hsp33 family molecular chaperone HslO [Bacillota bacterium]
MSNVYTAIDKSGSYRVYLAVTTDLVEEARVIHDTSPVATAGLGRVLTGTGLMGLMLKNQSDKLTVIFKGDGPAKQILATAFADGRVKGYIANPYVDLPLNECGKLNVGGSLGIGDLTVIKDLGLREPYVGTIALVDGEIADDLTAYYYISEQQNTAISLGVKIDTDCSVKAAGGMIIQMLPDAEDGAVDALEKMLAELPPVTTLVEDAAKAADGRGNEQILMLMMDRIFGAMPEAYKTEGLEYRELKWECDCSEDRLEQVLMTIGEKELSDIIEEDGQAELVCQFCCKKYHFDKGRLERILASIRQV